MGKNWCFYHIISTNVLSLKNYLKIVKKSYKCSYYYFFFFVITRMEQLKWKNAQKNNLNIDSEERKRKYNIMKDIKKNLE